MGLSKGGVIIRKVDDLGRIVIPKGLRDKLEIDVDDLVEIVDDGDRLIVRRYRPKCVFCGGVERLLEYNGKFICRGCIDVLSK